MNKAPIIGYEQINCIADAFNPAIRDHDGITYAIEIANCQRDADHKYYLETLTQEIKKVENPNINTGEDEELVNVVARQAFEQCRQKILNLLEEL